MSARRRLDAELVRRGLAPSRERAQADIAGGRVTVGGAPAPAVPTVNVVVNVVVASDVTTLAVMECGPAATLLVSQGLALPAESVPTKSIGAEPST